MFKNKVSPVLLLIAALGSGYVVAEKTATAQNSVHVLQSGYEYEKNDELRVGSSITLIKSPSAIVVTDPGMTADRQTIAEALAKQSVALADVTHVFISHQHMDHTLNVGLFPNAVVVDYSSIYDKDLWIDHTGDYEIATGIRVVATPGHTDEDASLLVSTPSGLYAITHAWWHEDMTPAIDPFAENQSQLESSRQRLLQQADWIVPGHGKLFKNPKKP